MNQNIQPTTASCAVNHYTLCNDVKTLQNNFELTGLCALDSINQTRGILSLMLKTLKGDQARIDIDALKNAAFAANYIMDLAANDVDLSLEQNGFYSKTQEKV